MDDTEITESVEGQCFFYVSVVSQNKVASFKNLSLFLKHFNMYERDHLQEGFDGLGM